MSNVRVVRPRPLAVDDRIPVYWAGREAPPQIRAVDGGTLYDHLVSCETQDTQQRKRRKGGKYNAPKEVEQPHSASQSTRASYYVRVDTAA